MDLEAIENAYGVVERAEREPRLGMLVVFYAGGERGLGPRPVLGDRLQLPMAGWHPDSEWFWLGDRMGPQGTPWARKAIEMRQVDRALANTYAKRALDACPSAWQGWYTSFTGIPMPLPMPLPG